MEIEGDGKIQNGKKEVGGNSYRNINCWLVKNLKYAPYKRCQYCEFKFRNCLFLQYQTISLFLLLLFFSLFLLIEKRLSLLEIITVFASIIIYGYFFNKSTEKIVKSNFSLKKTEDALEELTDKLEEKVDEQTKDITRKNEQLEALIKMKSEFLSIASHQLRTPLSAIRGLLSMQAEGDFDSLPKEEAKKQQKNMLESANRLSNIVNGLLDAMELEGGSLNFAFQPVDLGIMIAEICTELKPNYDKKGLYLKFEKPKSAPTLEAEPKMLREALENIIDNAEKYTNKGGTAVTLERKGGQVIIQVADTGIGIPAGDKGRLFHKFSRGEKSVLQHTDGSGLGLFITKNVITEHHGTIDIASKGKGKGTTVTVKLPLTQSAFTKNGKE